MAKRNTASIKYSDLVAKCDEALKSGRGKDVRRLLEDITPTHVPRAARLSLAKLARRAGLVEFGLRLLTEIVHAEKGKRTKEPASPAELAEYAVLLQRTGATKEAVQRLKTLDAKELPDVNLYLAFSYFDMWEHGQAIPYLEAFVRSAPTPYMGLVGKVNLAAAHVAESNFESAQPILLECIATAETENYVRLLGNCLEMLGQIHVLQKRFQEAESYLARARAILGDSRGNDELFVKKWSAVLNAFKTSSIEPLLEFRNEAFARGQTEEARDADLYRLSVQFSASVFEHLYFGSSRKSYRNRIDALLGRKPSATTYIIGSSSGEILDVISGKTNRFALQTGSKTHQLLEILMRDFYRPMSAGEIFTELFPGEYFDIDSSPHRVRQVEHRLRKWFEENELPVIIESRNRFCSLKITGEFGITVPLERSSVDPYQSKLRVLRDVFKNGEAFSATGAREVINLTRREFQIFAKQALDSGDLDRFGAARNTSYLLRNAA